MPYAAPGQVGDDPIEGGIEISDDQYREAIVGMMDGKTVSIVDGAMLVTDPPDPEGPTVDQVTSHNIRNASPDSLFGGPLLKDIFNGN